MPCWCNWIHDLNLFFGGSTTLLWQSEFVALWSWYLVISFSPWRLCCLRPAILCFLQGGRWSGCYPCGLDISGNNSSKNLVCPLSLNVIFLRVVAASKHSLANDPNLSTHLMSELCCISCLPPPECSLWVGQNSLTVGELNSVGMLIG